MCIQDTVHICTQLTILFTALECESEVKLFWQIKIHVTAVQLQFAFSEQPIGGLQLPNEWSDMFSNVSCQCLQQYVTASARIFLHSLTRHVQR